MVFRPFENDPITKSGKLFAEKFMLGHHPTTPVPRQIDLNPECTPSRWSSHAQDPEGFLAHQMPPPTPQRVNNLDVDNPPHSQPSETSIGVGDIIAEVSLDFAQSLFHGTTTMSGETVATASTSNEKCSDTFTSELTSKEEVIAEKYHKMLKMGVPLDGVLHKMAQESVDLKITLVVLQEVSLPLSASAKVESDNTHQVKMSVKTDAPLLSDKEEAIATTYCNMLKVCIPKEAVQHKMPPPTPRRVNNLDVDNPPHQPSETSIGVGDIIAEVRLDFAQSLFRGTTTMSGETVATASTSNEKCSDTFTSELTSKEEVIAEKYHKMLKMGVPLDGVLHKMAQESVDLKITLVVLQEVSLPLSASAKVESDNTHQVKMSAKTDAPLLSDEEEAIATTYRNMLKVCIPKEAVRHKMKQDGIVIKIVEAVLGKDATAVTGSDSMSIQTKTTNRKTIAFHWTTSNLAPKLLEQSIFGWTLEK